MAATDRFVIEEHDRGTVSDPWNRLWIVRDAKTGENLYQSNRYHDVRAVAQQYNRSPEGYGNLRPPVRSYDNVGQVLHDGFVLSTDPLAKPPAIGDEAVVYARGGLRLGLVSKIGRTTVYVDVATPTSPDLITKGKIGGRWHERGYLKSRSQA